MFLSTSISPVSSLLFSTALTTIINIGPGAENWLQGISINNSEFLFSSITDQVINGVTGIDFNSDYSKVYLSENHGSEVFAMVLSTNGDISTATWDPNNYINLDLVSNLDELSGIRVSQDETVIWLSDHLNNTITTWNMSVAGDVSTMTQDLTKTLDCSPYISNIRSFEFLNNGSILQIGGTGVNSNRIKTLNLGTPYDVSTVTSENTSNTVDFGTNEPRGFAYNENGTEIYILGFSTNNILKYDLSIPYDLSTATTGTGAEYVLDVSSLFGTNLSDIYLNFTHRKMYVASVGQGKIGTGIYNNLLDITISTLNVEENQAQGTTIATLGNIETGTTVSLENDAGGKIALDGNNLVVGVNGINYETETSLDIILRKTNADYNNSPRDTSFTLNVTNVVDDPPAAFGVADWNGVVTDETTIQLQILSLPHSDSPITDIEYRIDSGTWVSTGLTDVGNLDLTGLTTGVELALEVRAISALGNGTISDTKLRTPENATSPYIDSVFASTVFEINAASTDSYGGTGTGVTNVIASPATGLQNDYNFSLLDATFVGTAGTPGAYFDIGLKNMAMDATNAFMNSLHVSQAQDWTILVACRFGQNGTSFSAFCTGGGVLQDGIEFLISSEAGSTVNNRIAFRNNASRKVNTLDSVGDLRNNDFNLIMYTYNATTDIVTARISETQALSASNPSPSTVPNPTGTTFRFSRDNGSAPWGTGSRIYGVAAFNQAFDLSDYQAAKLYMEQQHGISFV